jgi:hypothetical protein
LSQVCCPLSEIGKKDESSLSSDSNNNLIQDHSGFSSSARSSKRKTNFQPEDRKEHERLLFPDDINDNDHRDQILTKQIPVIHPSEQRRSGGSGKFRTVVNLLPSLEECGSSIKLSRHVGTFGAYPWVAVMGNKGKNCLNDYS